MGEVVGWRVRRSETGVRWSLRYSDDQPRDENGRWSGDGGGDISSGGGGRSDPLAEVLGNSTPAGDYGRSFSTFAEAATAQEQAMSAPQREALDLYTGTQYRSINGALRGNQAMDAATASLANDLDHAIADHGFALANDSTVYRGVQADSTGLAAGQVLQDNAFLSTSASADIANGFSFAGDQQTGPTTSYVLQIAAPAGTPYVVGDANELELVMPRSTPLVIDSVDSGYKQGYLNLPRVYAHIAG